MALGSLFFQGTVAYRIDDMPSNPFHDLYLSEAISEEALVEIFSPIIVELAGAVFEPGNVIIKGLQGTGKTMLLNLLRPESRIAYRKARVKFPVPKEQAKFIGAGVNLRKCGALEFAQHLQVNSDERQIQELELLFADFINYWIVSDVLATILKFADAADDSLCDELGLSLDPGKLKIFAETFSLDHCWFGAHSKASSIHEFQVSLANRIGWYRRFLNLNIDELPSEILGSKTVIGDPILKMAETLRNSGVIDESTKVFVRIDQYEQLTTLNVAGTKYGEACQQLIHKAIGARDGRVSYRIGTRSHGWPSRPTIYRTTDTLELKRDFSFLDMDELFRRRENARTWKFPDFARDIFARRLRAAAFHSHDTLKKSSLSDALGDSPKPQERAIKYVSTSSGIDIIQREMLKIEDLPSNWKQYIERLSTKDALASWLACAWVRQKSAGPRKKNSGLADPPAGDDKPWKPYWYKERVPHALMQLASENRQALAWSGEDEILNLSGGQILVFLFLLQHVWDAWLRDSRGMTDALVFPISPDVQSQGVIEASQEWKTKQIEGPNARQRRVFVDAVGRHLYRRLITDKTMSYPGANGFSLRVDDLEKDAQLSAFLCQAVGYGDLYEAPHTSKNPGEKRTKYYLAPILSPVFRIPSVHTKEPEYINIGQANKWLSGGDAKASEVTTAASPLQSSLFGDDAE
jgi:hypothetical protein